MARETLQLQYGINVHADHVFKGYTPLKMTAAYPDPESNALREALAEYVGVSKDMVMCGNGSDELIDVYIRTFAGEDKDFAVAYSPPMYYQYPEYAKRVGAKTVRLPHDRQAITPELVKKHGGDPLTIAVMLDTPSNPAGDTVSRRQVVALLEAGYKVFVDEAYYEFHGETMVDLIPLYPTQLVISRTLSKICAMSGSRVGYIIADSAMITRLHKLKMLFNINSEAQARALYAIKHMDEFIQAIPIMREAKQFAHEAIEKLGRYQLFSSLDLYVIFRHHTIPSSELQKTLRDQFAIETYLFDDFKGYSVIRVATAKKPALERLVDALATIK
jgi:histidinol-phosphate aminotransferase